MIERNVRAATPTDASAMSLLLGQLGYPSEAARVAARLARLEADPASAVFVAEDDGEVVGLCALHVIRLIELDSAVCRVTAMVVRSDARGHGVGRALLEQVEAEAERLRCDRIEVTSNDRRDDAHAFYRSLGFEDAPQRFVKQLRRRK
jgi:GNAT superfamily N-acetyltransferase